MMAQTQDGTPYNEKFKLRYSWEFEKVPAVRWQIQDVLPCSGITVLHGQPKSFKTYIAQSMALSCAAGVPWQGLKTRKATVLYIGPEGFFGLIRRQRAWEQSNSVEPVRFAYWPIAVNFKDRNSFTDALRALGAQKLRPDFIVVDTLQRASVGADENAVKDVGEVFENLNAFLSALSDPESSKPPTCLIIHHDTKSGSGFRGSSSIFGAVDGMLLAERKDENVQLSCDAFREGEAFDPIRVLFHGAVNVMTEDGWQTEVAVRARLTPQDRFDALINAPLDQFKTPQWSNDQQAVIKALEEKGLAFTALLNVTKEFVGGDGLPQTPMTSGRLTRALDALKEKGVVNHDEKVYTLNGSVRSDREFSSVRFTPKGGEPTELRTELANELNRTDEPPVAGIDTPLNSTDARIPPITTNMPEPLPPDTVNATNGPPNYNSLIEALDDSQLERDRVADGTS